MADQIENPRQDVQTQEMKDNVTNQLTEEHVPSAINMVLANPVQSYDEFVESFVYLKKEDVEDFIPGSNDYPDSVQNNVDTGGQFGVRLPSEETGGQVETNLVEKKRMEEEDVVETEVLAEGANSLTTPRDRLPAEQKYVKVDNFVDQASSDEESDDPLLEDICQLLEDSKDPASKGLKLTKDLKEDVEKVTFSDNNIPETQGTVQEKKGLSSNIPGEAEDVVNQPGIVVKANETRLNVGISNINQDVAQEAQTDEVQPFQLDPNFDYDNVKLTPKWGTKDRLPPEG
ncbi:hypothetical protein HOLleu_36270 [Holothuria leucospilota]|uniref:Uncharacterized protein n=1 Tax=Holothuria leucospilota TaxID=206669 RepID=A0A9Q0YLP0_HOLLE|nr:hypothetical protein HOLleu_36270 [Holothuria leucospilota]